MEKFWREVMDEATALGLRWYERIALVLIVALMTVALRRIGADVLAHIKVSIEPGPVPVSDGGQAADRDLPPAQVVSGDPGGGATGDAG